MACRVVVVQNNSRSPPFIRRLPEDFPSAKLPKQSISLHWLARSKVSNCKACCSRLGKAHTIRKLSVGVKWGPSAVQCVRANTSASLSTTLLKRHAWANPAGHSIAAVRALFKSRMFGTAGGKGGPNAVQCVRASTGMPSCIWQRARSDHAECMRMHMAGVVLGRGPRAPHQLAYTRHRWRCTMSSLCRALLAQ